MLLLVDGNALFYRAYHAFPKEFTTPDGRPSGAAFGFTRILLAAIRTHKPSHVAVCFDVEGPTFRDDLYESYKATRSAMPDDLKAQVPMIWELVKRLEVPLFSAPRYEADDLIGTLAQQAVKQYDDLDVLVLSGDQDLLQLVTDRVHVYAPHIGFAKAALYDPKAVQDKYGFSPIQMIEYKSLRGDASDNIPGVPGIGEVTAKQLLAEFHSLEGIYTAIQAGKATSVKAGVLAKLQAGEASGRLSHTLATIKTDAPVNLELDGCKLEIAHPENLIALFQEYGFKSLIQELPKSHKLVSEAADVFAGAATASYEAAPVEPQNESEELDVKLAPILRSMEERGAMIDKPYLADLQVEYTEEIEKLKDRLNSLAGQPFNPDSPQQVSYILYDVMHAPTQFVRKGKTGYTTDAATLSALAPTLPIAEVLLNYREITKLQSTYIKPLQEIADEHDRLHTSYAPDTATGRISSRNPNLQNIPIRKEQGKRIRRAFIAPKGKKLIVADYSQMELRIAAHLSQDPVMIEAFKTGQDFHEQTATRMGVDRRTAKIINFSILYGKTAFTFAGDLGITVEEAKKYIEQYFTTFAKLKQYVDKVLEEARTNGYVTTMLNRRRYLPDITSSNFQRRSAAEREAVNLPIQGSQAEFLKQAMVNLEPLLEKIPGAQMILTVHDELVVEANEADEEKVAKVLKKTMVEAMELSVPVEVQVKSGSNWAELTPLNL